MNISDWIQAILALITLLGILASLFIGLRSIRATRNIQARLERNQLLDRTEQWAIELAKSGIQSEPARLSMDKDANRAWPYLAKQLANMTELEMLRARSVAVEEISKNINATLGNAINKASDQLMEQLRLLNVYREFEDNRNKSETVRTDFLSSTALAVEKNYASIYTAATDIIERVSDLR